MKTRMRTPLYSRPMLVTLLIALALACSFGSARANDFVNSRSANIEQVFVVSGVLRKSTTDVVIKLAQSVERARSEDEAVGQFSRRVAHDFPNYSIMDTAVTPLPMPKACGTAI